MTSQFADSTDVLNIAREKQGYTAVEKYLQLLGVEPNANIDAEGAGEVSDMEQKVLGERKRVMQTLLDSRDAQVSARLRYKTELTKETGGVPATGMLHAADKYWNDMARAPHRVLVANKLVRGGSSSPKLSSSALLLLSNILGLVPDSSARITQGAGGKGMTVLA